MVGQRKIIAKIIVAKNSRYIDFIDVYKIDFDINVKSINKK